MRQAVIGFSMLYLATWLAAFPFVAPPETRILATLLAPPMIWLSVTDFMEEIIPDSATLTIAALGIGSAWMAGGAIWLPLLSAFAVLAAAWLAGEVWFRWRGREGLGIGDAKLLGAITAVVGPFDLWVVVFLAAVPGIMAILAGRMSGRVADSCPFGPFLAYSCFLTVLLYSRS